MKRPTDRRAMLATIGAAVFAAAVNPDAARSSDVRGTVTFEGGAVIPAGHLHVYLEDPGDREPARRHGAETRIRSEGGSRAINFSLVLPEGSSTSPKLTIIARLERADGWLLARGSTRFEAGSLIQVTLNKVTY